MNLFELFVKIGVDDQASEKVNSLSHNFKEKLTSAVKMADAALVSLGGAAIKSFSSFEQLAGGAAKVFDEMNQNEILRDANNAFKELGLSANQYLAVINDVGAAFAATMGDEAGYEAAKTGLKAISDYASGTGKNVDELSQKFTLITRSTSSYQSIADQFSGILPATSSGFLEQAQAVGILSESYTQLTDVPIAEYQAAVSKMLEQGVADLGLANNTVLESETTISGSFAAMKAAADNFLVALIDDNADVGESFSVLTSTVGSFLDNLIPKVWDFIDALGPVGPLLSGITAALGAFHVAVSISKVVGAAVTAFEAYRKANEGATIAQWAMNAAMNANPITLVVTLIAGLVAALITLWNTNDDFRNALIDAWTDIKNTAVNMWESINDGFDNFVNNAKTWGKDLIDNFVGGIKEKVNSLKNTVSNVAQTVKDFLGFSEPKKGPLSNFHTYAPDMMELFAQGIRENENKITSQIEKSFNFGTKTVDFAVSSVTGGANNSGSFDSSARSAAVDSAPINIVVQTVLDGRIIGETSYQYIKNKEKAYGLA